MSDAILVFLHMLGALVGISFMAYKLGRYVERRKVERGPFQARKRAENTQLVEPKAPLIVGYATVTNAPFYCLRCVGSLMSGVACPGGCTDKRCECSCAECAKAGTP